LNGLHGDFLERRGNALAIPMGLRHEGRELPLARAALERALPDATGRVCLFVHGLGCTETEWSFGDAATNYGVLLARDLGITPLYLRFNSGLHIAENGRRLARLLDALAAAYPRAIDQIALVGHSMGGLVARSAAHHGGDAAWVAKLRHVVCIASPHRGAPLAKGLDLL